MEVSLALLADYANVTAEGKLNILDIHLEFPELRATVARQDELPIGYVQKAIRLTDQLEELRRKAKEEGGS